MNHSQKCLEHLKELGRVRIEFELEFPDFCRTCDATGWNISYDSVPYGSTNVLMEGGEHCEDCIGLYLCPRCRLVGDYDESSNTFTCCKCGYKSDDPKQCAGAPPLPDEYDNCICDALEDSLVESYQN